MFERYPNESVRTLLRARAAAVAAGAPSIEAEHLLHAAMEAWSRGSRASVPSDPPGPASPEIRFSESVKRILNLAMAEADRLGHHRIRPEHLLLALLDEADEHPIAALRHVGVGRLELTESAARGARQDDSPLPHTAGHLSARLSETE
jgi:ATP-dependent Clp protease ATP-binding subunit ClpA